MRNHSGKGFVAVGLFLATFVVVASANASSLRQGSTASSAQVTGALPGEVLWGFYETFLSPLGNGDNILRLVNPNGAANGNLAGAQEQTVCAMIYVFDQEEEMGECCGCPLTSAGLATFSVNKNLTADWGLRLIPEHGSLSNANGSLAVVAAAPNTTGCLAGGGGKACNGGCDPTNVPGYSVTTANNLLGSITHNQAIFELTGLQVPARPIGQFGLTEVPLNDDGAGDPTNLIYLQTQCGALIGNGSGGGICTCPIE